MEPVPEKPGGLVYEKIIVPVMIDVGDEEGQFRGASHYTADVF
jgi:hypothetical protein